MKKLVVLMLAFSIGTFYSFANDNAAISGGEDPKVPKKVLKAFHKAYPTAQDVEWEKEDDGMYEVEFELQGVDSEITYNAKGKLIGKSMKGELDDLPQAALDYITENYAAWEIEDVDVEDPKEPDMHYEVELERETTDGEMEIELVFSERGVFMRKIVQSDADGDWLDELEKKADEIEDDID